jgi:VCBS repeat-containing protein
LTIIGLPSLSLNGAAIRVGTNGDIEYDPTAAALLQILAPGQTRLDTFTYRVRDAAGRTSNLATVTISVTGINDAPLLLPDNPTLVPGGQTIIHPLDNDIDIDGTINPATLRITLQPAFGSLVVQPDGTLIYTPFDNFRGQDTIRYTVADNLGAVSEEQTITIDVNVAPVAVKDSSGTFRDEAIDINVAANDSDTAPGTLDLNSIEIVTPPVRGTATVAGNGIVRFLPEPGFIGNDFFEYTIRDNGGRASNVARVSLQTVGSRLQNPRNFTDVNGSGITSPLDALLIINLLARAQRNGQGVNIPVLSTDRGPNFYDTDGNLVISANDALRVINQLARDARRGRTSGEGEAAPTPQVSTTPLTAAAIADAVVTTFEDQDYQVDFTTPSDHVVTAIAVESEDDKEAREFEYVAAIDAAWADVED